MRWVGLVLVAVAVMACSDDNGGPADVAGLWSGTFTNDSIDVTSAVFDLEQDDDVVTGTLTLNTGRTATITNGQVGAVVFTASLDYNDVDCPGSIELEADIGDGTMDGTYTAEDCDSGDGEAGEFALDRQ